MAQVKIRVRLVISWEGEATAGMHEVEHADLLDVDALLPPDEQRHEVIAEALASVAVGLAEGVIGSEFM